MAFQLAVGGRLPEAGPVLDAVRGRLGDILAWLEPASGGPGVQFLMSPAYTDERWASLPGVDREDVFCFCKRDDPDWSARCGKTLWEDTPLRGVLGEAMCDRADLVLAVWDEDVTEISGATWELIQLAHKERTPCLWLSARTGAAYWSKESYYEPLSDEGLKKLCTAHKARAPEPALAEGRRDPLLALGARLRRRFLRKYDALKPETAPEEDHILQDGFSLEEERAGSERVRRGILARYSRFDSAAISLNGEYQAVLYWRAILPFVASAFLAVGFYAEPLLSVTGMGSTPRAVLAGTGFLIHGLLNLYVYFLSRNGSIQRKHQAFLQNRYIAEVLRVLVHLVPYGVYADLRDVCGGSEELRAGLQEMTLADEPDVQRLDGRTAHMALVHIHEMLADQIAYHKAAAARLQRVLDQLDKLYQLIFKLGFALVILRGFLQFYVCVSPITGKIGAADLNSFIRSAANMIALMVPAWAAYFSSKISLCNFRFDYDSHVRTEDSLDDLLAQVDTLLAMEDAVPVDVMNNLSEELVRSMIVEDALAWERKYQSATVTQL